MRQTTTSVPSKRANGARLEWSGLRTPNCASTRMTREWLQDAIEYNYDGHRGRSKFLPWCWVSRAMYERWAAKHNLPISPPRFRPEHAVTAVVAQATASDRLPRPTAKRRRPADEQIRQELEKKAREYINTPGGKTCWSIAGRLVEIRGSTRQSEVDKKSKALKRYYAQLNDRSQD